MVKHKVEEITISAKGKNIEEAFSKLAVSMFDLVIDTNQIKQDMTKTIIMRAKDLKTLLFQYLKKLFDMANNELFLLSKVKQITIEQISNEYMLNSVIVGDKMNPNYEVKDIVKQITDRNISIKEDTTGTTVQINLVVERRNVEDEV